jgi:hypothetical protein
MAAILRALANRLKAAPAPRSTLTLAEESLYQSQINAQTRVINQQNNIINKLQADRRIRPNEVVPLATATNKRLEARQERQRIQMERSIARTSNPTIAARLQTGSARAAERQRKAILDNAARGR